jgi:ligand-binding sensor domain-containing protein
MSYKAKSYWFALLFFLPFALITPNVQAQDAPTKSQLDFRFMHLSVEDGLAHNSVTVVIQDSTGFMWFGTADGLSRYDGYSFTNFKHDPSNKQSLSGNEVNDLLLADDGRLWVATETGGVSIFDPLTETFSQFQPDNQPDFERTNVTSLFKDEVGNIWLGMSEGRVGEFDQANNVYRAYQLPRESDPRFVWDITREGTGTVWFAASTVFRMDLETAVIAPYRPVHWKGNARCFSRRAAMIICANRFGSLRFLI